MTFGERVRYYRERIGMTQSELAEVLGYRDKGSVSRIESDKTDLPRSKIVMIAQVFGVSPVELMGLNEPAPISRPRQVAYDRLENASDEQIEQLNDLLDVIWRETEE